MATFKIYWQWKERYRKSVTLFATLSPDERTALSASLKAILNDHDVSGFLFEEIDIQTASHTLLSDADVRKAIASRLGVSQLP